MLQVKNIDKQLPPSIDIIRKMEQPGPRYTSYPTADRFHGAFGRKEYGVALHNLNLACLVKPLSIYVHIPFCDTVCYYCACHKVVTKDYSKSQPYLEALLAEATLIRQSIRQSSEVTQLHLGGGTPTFFSDKQLKELLDGLRNLFSISERFECSIEIDPRTVDADRLERLHQIGFNRISFGVQDFDESVQKAVHRIQPYEQVEALMHRARQLGYRSINVDLIYGLPKQTPSSFQQTLRKIATLRPDRIAVYAYAHLPERFMPQRRINEQDLPSAPQRVQMLSDAISVLGEEGWDYIGMDHFALPDDPLAIAKKQGCLHRNFQGYSTHAECDLIGLGVSAISKVGQTYAQNNKDLDSYYGSLSSSELPILRGYLMDKDDLLRQSVIMSVMCQGNVHYETVEQAHLIHFKDYFATELESLAKYVDEGLLILDDDCLQVTEAGWFLVRAIAREFDKHIRSSGQSTVKFSKMV